MSITVFRHNKTCLKFSRVIVSSSRIFQQQRSIQTVRTHWGQYYARRHRDIWESSPPNVPSTDEYDEHDIKQMKLNNVTPVPPVWQSRRTPLMGYKIGCMGLWDEWGVRHCVTVVKVDRLYIMEQLSIAKHGIEGLKIGMGARHATKASNAQIGDAIKQHLAIKPDIHSRPCSSDCHLPVGHELSVRHFTPGQWVMVGGKTKAKGFQGVVKRWGFQGQDSGHSHDGTSSRNGGSIGASGYCNTRRGTKMAGHVGPDPRTTLCCVFRTESFRNLIFLKGMVPCPSGGCVTIWDARGSGWVRNKNIKIPWPTFIPKIGVQYPVTQQRPPQQLDPFLYTERPIYKDGKQSK